MLDPSISDPERVLAFWFPFGLDADAAAHGAWFRWAFGGGADAEIRQRFVPVLEAAAAGKLDGWAVAPRARLALIVVLDQFSRTVWQGDARAYAQDARARELALEGIACGTAHIVDTYREIGAPPGRIYAVGGGTKNLAWAQATSDVSGLAQILRRRTIGASYGDAFLAAVAVGDAKRSDEERDAARLGLQKLPRNANPTRQRNRCEITGRPRGTFRQFGLARAKIRELAFAGDIPGVTKASW